MFTPLGQPLGRSVHVCGTNRVWCRVWRGVVVVVIVGLEEGWLPDGAEEGLGVNLLAPFEQLLLQIPLSVQSLALPY